METWQRLDTIIDKIMDKQMNESQTAIANWHKATEELAIAFTRKYFKTERYGKDTFWVSDEIGGVFVVGDYFFNVDHMLQALELNVSGKKLFEYYDYELDHAIKQDGTPTPINFKNYVKYGKKINNNKQG